MIKSIFFIINVVLWTFLLGTLAIVLGFIDKKGKLISFGIRCWSKILIFFSGVKIKIIGLENLNGVFHTHDMEKFDDDYLISSSNLGKIYSYNKKKFIKDINPWTRGITVSNTQLFIGKSGMGKRKFRHSRYYNGEIFVLDKFNLNIIKKVVISKIGQLNDIIYVDN